MRHFIALATLLAGFFFLQHPAVAQSYKVGDYYNDGKLEGVVFEVDASGKSGKIVSLTQPTDMFRPWCDDEGDKKRFINATDKYDGRKNHEVVEAIAGWQSKYPMFAWCRQLGAGWYLPAIEELKSFTLNRNTHAAVNRTLKAKGATPLADHSDSSSWYWSSTESAEYAKGVDEYSAHHVWMNQNYATTSYKSYPYFGVRAIARFGTASQSGSLKPAAATTSTPNTSSYTPQYCFNRGKQLRDQRNYEEAIPWLERAAEAKYRPAYRELADCYNTDGHNKTDPRKAWMNYANCVGGEGYDPNSHDYWYACFMLGNMFKVGRGCEKNFDSALYFLREFRKYTKPINYDTADKAINEVLALQRQEAAPAPSRTTTASTSTTPRQSSGSSGSKADMVARPAYGQLPNVVYMQNLDNEYLVMKMSFFQQDGKIMMRCNKGATLRLYILDTNEDDLWSFREAKIGPGASLTWNSVSYYPDRLGHMIVILKDWSRVGYQGFFVCERHITEAEYNRCEDIFQRGVRNMAAYAASMNGSGGGGSVGTAQVQSGMSESYYRNMYDQYARLAESTYNTLTSIGYSISVNDKESEGGTMGGWSSSDYSTLKRDLRNAQSNMSRIRTEAARAGYTISASHWESVSVSY